MLDNFKKMNIGLLAITLLSGGKWGSDEGSCGAGCDGNETFCPNSTSCVNIMCPNQNDTGSFTAFACGYSDIKFGQTTI